MKLESDSLPGLPTYSIKLNLSAVLKIMYISYIRLRINYLNHMVIVFLFNCVDGIEDLGHGVQHPTLRQGLGLLCQGLVTGRANPEADKDVGETEEAENKDQGLQEVIRVKRVDNPAKKGVR